MLVLVLVLGLGLLMLICVVGLLVLLLCGGSDSQEQWWASLSLSSLVSGLTISDRLITDVIRQLNIEISHLKVENGFKDGYMTKRSPTSITFIWRNVQKVSIPWLWTPCRSFNYIQCIPILVTTLIWSDWSQLIITKLLFKSSSPRSPVFFIFICPNVPLSRAVTTRREDIRV